MLFMNYGAIPTDDLNSAIIELHKGSDRAVAIVGGAIVEKFLDDALIKSFYRDDKMTEQLFRIDGALGAFATKIRIGYLTGLFGKIALTDLETMKNIRNKFAHRLDVSSFDNEQIAAWCENFKLGDRYYGDPGSTPEQPKPGTEPKDFPWWTGSAARDTLLSTPRGRYLVEVTILAYGLTIAHDTRMPSPLF